MHQSHRPPGSFLWTTCLEPILVTTVARRHIDDKHISTASERPAWNELPGEAASPFDRLQLLVADGMRRPCYIAYQQLNLKGAFLHHTREVMTHGGVVVVLRHSGLPKALWTLETAYCPQPVTSARLQRRWHVAIRSRVQAYSRLLRVSGRLLLLHPSASDEFPSSDPLGYRTDVRFVSPERWGFRTIPLDGEDFRVWQPPPPWPPPTSP